MRQFTPLFLALLISPPVTVADDSSAQLDTVRTSAKPVKRPAPRYPGVERARGHQGWVDLSYVVDPEGKVLDPIVIDSSGSRYFERAARNAVLKFEYEPATLNGKPVQQCETKVRVSFALEGATKLVSKNFYKRYRRIEKAIDHNDLEKANRLIEEADEMNGLTLSEIAWLWTARTRVFAKEGKKDEQLGAVRRATSSPNWVNDDLYANLLVLRTTLEIEKGLFADALRSYEMLQKTETRNQHTESLGVSIDKLKAFFDTDQIVSVPARIERTDDCEDCTPNWQYDPLRRQFSFANINGHLSKVEVRCDCNRFIDAINPDANDVWQLPSGWGDCSVFVFGEPGTTFEFYEVPPDHRSAN